MSTMFARGCFLKLVPITFALLQCYPASALDSSLAPIGLGAQQSAPPQFVPTDVTPFATTPERNSVSPGFKFRLFQKLPERFWFTSSTEVSQRLDTNVLFTANNPKADYAIRMLPSITAGYNVLKNTSIYTNYFVIKDTFATHQFLNYPTTQSLAWGIRHNKRLGERTDLQFDMQARELWQTSHLHQFDFLPGVSLTRMLTRKDIIFASALLQMRGGEYFVAPTRELDPFYSLGYIRRQGQYTLLCTDTLVTNFRSPTFNGSVPKQSNVSMIADVEVNRPISKRCPSLLAFVRAEPVLNWGAHKTPGLSGFDFRLFTGVRFTVSKPSYYAAMDTMRHQILVRKQTEQSQSASNQPDSNDVSPNNVLAKPSVMQDADSPVGSSDEGVKASPTTSNPHDAAPNSISSNESSYTMSKAIIAQTSAALPTEGP